MCGSPEVMAAPQPKVNQTTMSLPADITLPTVAKELIELIGWEDACALMKQFGGAYLDIPINPTRALQLQSAVSTEAVNKLCAHYAGSRISYVPKLDAVLRAIRDERIRADCQTLPRRAVALKYGVSIQTVYTIAGDVQRDTSYQISLF